MISSKGDYDVTGLYVDEDNKSCRQKSDDEVVELVMGESFGESVGKVILSRNMERGSL